MSTGCQPPYCHGTGGFCGCNCKCCPPPCCPVISVYFQCCQPMPLELTQSAATSLAWDNLPLNGPILEKLPEFSEEPIISEDGNFSLGFGSGPPSCPCVTTCVELQCGGFGMPCCCLELLDGVIYSVGNGYVTAPTTVNVPGCGEATVLINGLPPPVFVNDCDIIVVTLMVIVTDPPCCTSQCYQIDVQCSPCPSPMAMAGDSPRTPLWKRKIDPRTGKTKINPNTGRPIITVSKSELLKRVIKRINQSKRRR